MKKISISIIIPTVGRGAIFLRSLQSVIEASKNKNIEIIIINDSKSELKIPYTYNNLYVYNNTKSGAASARNLGIEKANSDLLLFIDDDIIINRYNIERTIELHENGSNAGYNFFWIYPPDLIEKLPNSQFGKYILNKLTFTNSYRLVYNLSSTNNLIKEDGLTSQYFSISKKDILEAGGYPDNIPYAGVEDMILYKNLKKNGIDIYLSTKDIVFQNEENRISLEKTMDRYKTGAFTRKIATIIGHKDLSVNLPLKKIIVCRIFFPLKNIIRLISKVMGYNKFYVKVVNLLLLLSTYEGFYKSKLPADFSN